MAAGSAIRETREGERGQRGSERFGTPSEGSHHLARTVSAKMPSRVRSCQPCHQAGTCLMARHAHAQHAKLKHSCTCSREM